MHEHSYIGCSHELKHCSHCDVVFCEKCRREWKQQATLGYQWNTYLQQRAQQQYLPKPPAFVGQVLCSHSGA